MPRLGRHLARLVQRDETRTTIQTVAAVLMSFAVMEFLPLNTTSWAVFSALFVVQANIGGTVGYALQRVAGALVGAVIAVGLIFITGHGDHTLTVLAAGVALMSALAIRWPSLSYGLVTVAIIAVSPDIDLIESAFQKVAAITIGSCSAILACMLILPVSAHRRARNQLAEALRVSGEYIGECMTCILGDKERSEIAGSRTKALTALHKASLMREQANIEKAPVHFTKQRRPEMSNAVLEAARQLTEGLSVADQFSSPPSSSQLEEAQIKAIQALSQSIHEQLSLLGDAIAGFCNCADIPAVWEHYHHFCETVDHSSADNHSNEQREYFIALKWAYHSILSSIDALAQQIEDSHSAAAKHSTG